MGNAKRVGDITLKLATKEMISRHDWRKRNNDGYQNRPGTQAQWNKQ
jgi:hypothetical protein